MVFVKPAEQARLAQLLRLDDTEVQSRLNDARGFSRFKVVELKQMLDFFSQEYGVRLRKYGLKADHVLVLNAFCSSPEYRASAVNAAQPPSSAAASPSSPPPGPAPQPPPSALNDPSVAFATMFSQLVAHNPNALAAAITTAHANGTMGPGWGFEPDASPASASPSPPPCRKKIKTERTEPDDDPPQPHEQEPLRCLVQMGFERSPALSALRRTANDMEGAMMHLVQAMEEREQARNVDSARIASENQAKHDKQLRERLEHEALAQGAVSIQTTLRNWASRSVLAAEGNTAVVQLVELLDGLAHEARGGTLDGADGSMIVDVDAEPDGSGRDGGPTSAELTDALQSVRPVVVRLLLLERKALKWYPGVADAYCRAAAARVEAETATTVGALAQLRQPLPSPGTADGHARAVRACLDREVAALETALYAMPSSGECIPDAFVAFKASVSESDAALAESGIQLIATAPAATAPTAAAPSSSGLVISLVGEEE